MSRQRWPLAALATVALIGAGCGSNAPSETTGTARSAGGTSAGGNTTDTNHEKAVKFAECMRNNGVSAFPDPKASGGLTIDAIANGSSVDTSAPAWTRALGACKHLEPSGFMGHTRSGQEQRAALEFAQCIRNNGVPDFPDPTPNGPLVDTNRIPSSATSSGMSILNAAMHKCGAIYSGELGLRGQ